MVAWITKVAAVAAAASNVITVVEKVIWPETVLNPEKKETIATEEAELLPVITAVKKVTCLVIAQSLVKKENADP